MRKKRLFYNIITSMVLQVVTAIVGFILPSLMIQYFGSEVNGLISSINQFLSYIALLEGGVGGVTRAALYKPLAEGNILEISKVIKGTDSFYKKISLGFLMYVFIVSIAFMFKVKDTFSFTFTVSLIFIISISTMVQYLFGIKYSLLLQADQRNYVLNILQCITVVFNLLFTMIVIRCNGTIHELKLATASLYVIKPIIVWIIIKKNYHLVHDCEKSEIIAKKKGDALIHHIAWYLHQNTDVAIITLFGTLTDVSVYSVYNLVASSLVQLVSAFSGGAESLFGNMLAIDDKKQVRKKFSAYTLVMSFISCVLFATAIVMVVPFVGLYTRNIKDADYILPSLGYALIIAELIYCIRMPYHSVITASGHFAQTKKSAIVEVCINIILSVVLFQFLGISGVAVATAIAMGYRTVYYAFYLSNNILNININEFFRHILLIIVSISLSIFFSRQLCVDVYHNYFDFIQYGVIDFLIAFATTGIVFLTFEFKTVKFLVGMWR